MNHRLFDTVGSIIIFSIWLFIAVTAIREYIRLMKTPGMRMFMTKKEMLAIKDITFLDAVSRWKRVAKWLAVLWIMSVFIYMLVAIIIEHTAGFIDA